MSYGNERYGGGDDGDYSRRNEGNYGGRDEYGGDNRGGYGGGGRQEFGNSGGDQGYGGQSGSYGQGNPEHGRHHRRDDEAGYEDRRDELRNHAQSGYGSVSGPGYGGPGDRVSSNNPESRYGSGYNEGDRFNGGNNDGGYGGRNDNDDRRYGGGNNNEGRYGGGNGGYGGGNGGHGHSSGTSYGDVPGGSDDYSSAAHTAAQHAGDSGDSNLFSNALGMLSGHKAQQEDLDEDDAMRQHQQFYGGAGQPHPASSGSMGSAAAMQALKMFNQGGSSSGNGPKSQNDFIGLAMSQAAKLFGMQINHDLKDQSSQGNVHQQASKQDAISSAAQMALKMYMKSQGGGGGSSASGIMGLMSKFM
ncbi:unnamed protein product [Aureobasidium mustum]|uniref:DUF7721 domain-containing protein n=1 Tax=Aureobasidium mustum TaxID=2773714 RepID=A0A9N8PDP6_9PEZI|nr:unnamed protein product [Aureobasidium mustum]